MARAKKTAAQKWQGLFRKILKQVDDINDIGGIERVARMYSERDHQVIAGQLEELSEKFKNWASDLRGER